MKIAYLLGATLIGASFALQPAINGATAKILGSPVSSAVISVAITLLTCIVLLPVFGAKISGATVVNLPWWVVFGGLIGAGVVAGGAAIAPVTGAAVFFICMIAGQLVGSVLADHFGAFGLKEHPISPMRLVAIGLVFTGVLLVHLER